MSLVVSPSSSFFGGGATFSRFATAPRASSSTTVTSAGVGLSTRHQTSSCVGALLPSWTVSGERTRNPSRWYRSWGGVGAQRRVSGSESSTETSGTPSHPSVPVNTTEGNEVRPSLHAARASFTRHKGSSTGTEALRSAASLEVAATFVTGEGPTSSMRRMGLLSQLKLSRSSRYSHSGVAAS